MRISTHSRPALLAALLAAGLAASASAQTTFTWEQLKEKFEAANPTLKAARLSIDESRASEVTAYLRPNPNLNGSLDQISPFAPQAS